MFDIISFIQTIGYVGIFSVVFVESGIIFGFFFPGDSLLFTAGFLASQGLMNVWFLIAGTVISAVLGVSVGYVFGLKAGPMIFKKEDSLFFHKDNLEHTKHFYEKYGKKAIILARFMPGVRTFAPILAGVGKMDYPTFVLYNIIGGLLWGAGLPLAGYYLGNSIPNVDKYLLPIVLLIIFLSILPTAVHILSEKQSRDKICNFAKQIAGRRAKLLAFNWKMNPETLDEALKIAKTGDFKNAVVIPPFVFIEEVAKILKNARLGAQDLSGKNLTGGALTGEISAKELVNLGVKYVIVGHSERRAMGETDEIIARKLKTALDNGLIPILCVGEKLEERKNGSMKETVESQLSADLVLIKNTKKRVIIAYEPVWAIGTGNNCSPEDALKMIKFIKNILNSTLSMRSAGALYGGSVNPQNIKDFLKYKEIDGVLVGGASLKPEEFCDII